MNTPTGPEKVYQILKNLACIRDSDIQILRWSGLLKEIRELDGKRVKLWIQARALLGSLCFDLTWDILHA